MPLEFKSLPLQEVSIRIALPAEKKLPLEPRFYFDVWVALGGEKFGNITRVPSFDRAPGSAAPSVDPTNLPGVCIFDDENQVAITLRSDMVSVAWTASDAESTYPRYRHVLRPTAEKIGTIIKELLGEFFPSIVNVSYVNIIKINDPKMSDVHRYVNLFNISEEMMDVESPFLEAVFRYSGRFESRVTINAVNLTSQPSIESDALILSTVTGTRLLENEPYMVATDIVHNQASRFFESIITEEAKVEWQLQY